MAGRQPRAARIAAKLPEHMNQIKQDARVNTERRETLADMLQKMGVRVKPSRANFLLCDFEWDMRETVEYLKSRRILVREYTSFGLGTNFLRLAVRTEEKTKP